MFLGPLCSVVLFGLLATTDFVMTHHQIDIQAIFSHCAHLLNQIVIDINGNCGHSLRAELKRNTNIYSVQCSLYFEENTDFSITIAGIGLEYMVTSGIRVQRTVYCTQNTTVFLNAY